MSQLTSTDTILWSDLFRQTAKESGRNRIKAMADELKTQYALWIKQSRKAVKQILDTLPSEWNVPAATVADKLEQLFEKEWTEGVWNNFTECLNDNIQELPYEI